MRSAEPALDWALSDPETVSRYRAKVVVVGCSSCRWWRGALSAGDTAGSGWHVVRSSAGENRREWATRRALAGGSLTDRRGSRGRVRELRDALRADGGQPGFNLVALAGLGADGVQLPLWAVGQA